jgi:hypothetical protein
MSNNQAKLIYAHLKSKLRFHFNRRKKLRRKSLTKNLTQSLQRAIHGTSIACGRQIGSKFRETSFFIITPREEARALLCKLAERRCNMELIELTEDAALQLQEMLNTPIEDQAAAYELILLGSILQSGLHSLENSENGDETCEILRQMLKSAFVIGRRHINQLV